MLKSLCGGKRVLPSVLCITIYGDDKAIPNRSIFFIKSSIFSRIRFSVLHELLDVAHLMSTVMVSGAGNCHRSAKRILGKKELSSTDRSCVHLSNTTYANKGTIKDCCLLTCLQVFLFCSQQLFSRTSPNPYTNVRSTSFIANSGSSLSLRCFEALCLLV